MMIRFCIALATVCPAVVVLANCDIFESENTFARIENSTGWRNKCVWQYETQPYHNGLFLKLKQNNLPNVSTGNCLVDVWPTGNSSEMRLCHWDSPACFFFTRIKGICDRFIAKYVEECSHITWISNKALPLKFVSSFRKNDTIPADGWMHLQYQYFNYSEARNDTTTESVDDTTLSPGTAESVNPDFTTWLTKVFSGERILYVLIVAIFFILLSLILAVCLICKSAKNKDPKRRREASSEKRNVDEEHLQPSPSHDVASSCSHHSFNDSEQGVTDNVRTSAENSPAVEVNMKQMKSTFKNHGGSYEDVPLPSCFPPPPSAQESTPILRQESHVANNESCSRESIGDQAIQTTESKLPAAHEDDDGLYDKLNGHLTQEVAYASRSSLDSDRSESIPLPAEKPEATMYEDVSEVLKDARDYKYTKIVPKKSASDKDNPEEVLYDQVNRE